jgi:hypothetical protein
MVAPSGKPLAQAERAVGEVRLPGERAPDRPVGPDQLASWTSRLPGQIPDRLVLAEPLDGRTIELEGHELIAVPGRTHRHRPDDRPP